MRNKVFFTHPVTFDVRCEHYSIHIINRTLYIVILGSFGSSLWMLDELRDEMLRTIIRKELELVNLRTTPIELLVSVGCLNEIGAFSPNSFSKDALLFKPYVTVDGTVKTDWNNRKNPSKELLDALIKEMS